MKIMRAKHCAWRGLYLIQRSGRVLAAIILDPNSGIMPHIDIHLGESEFRIPLPWVRFDHKMGRVKFFFYRLLQWVYFKMDGRFTKSAKRERAQCR